MLTRSKVNYSGISMKDLVALMPSESRSNTRTKTRNICLSNNTVLGNVMLFDIESYAINVKNPVSSSILKKWIPHQIAWRVYDDNLKCVSKKNYYVSEIWVTPHYRSAIAKQYPHSFKKHLDKVTKNDYPMKSSKKIINKMLDIIEEFNVKTIMSYNIYSDFESLKDLVQYIPSKNELDNSLFDCKYSNPFRININYCDLMHNVGLLYMDYLIDEGFKDEKIFRNAKTKKIKLTGRDNSIGVYSAEYVLRKFFNDKQPHTADGDVKLEIKLLKKMVDEFGEKELELNVMYPKKLYDQFASKIMNEHVQKVKTAYLYSHNTEKLEQKPCNDNIQNTAQE